MKEIRTKRTRLRLLTPSDLHVVHELHSFPELAKYNTLGIPKDIEETKAIVKTSVEGNQKSEIMSYSFAVELLETGNVIGLFGFNLGNKKYKDAEVWYKIHPEFWNKGYATETLKAVIFFGFETLNLHRIQAGCAIENLASIKVLEKCGMIREGHCRQTLPLKTGWADNYEYALLETDGRKK